MSELGQRVIAEVRRLAAENRHFVYEPPANDQCVYLYEGKPSCIIGCALYPTGSLPHDLEKSLRNGHSIGSLVEALDLAIDPDEVQWLRSVQTKQDDDIPWGDAVEYADGVS